MARTYGISDIDAEDMGLRRPSARLTQPVPQKTLPQAPTKTAQSVTAVDPMAASPGLLSLGTVQNMLTTNQAPQQTGPAWVTYTLDGIPGRSGGLVNSVPHLQDQFKKLGYSGEIYNPPVSVAGPQGGDSSDGVNILPSVTPEFQKWLQDNKYTIQHRLVGADLQNRISDSAGNTVGNVASYDTNDGNWVEKAVPLAIGVMTGGLGAPLGAAMGLGNGLLGSAIGGGLVGGATSAAMGGDFLRGALSGGVGGALNVAFAAPGSAPTGGSGITAGGSSGYGSIGGTLGGSGGTTLGLAGGGMSAGAGLNSALLQSLASVAPMVNGATGLLNAAPIPVAPPVAPAASPAFNAAADSQLASSQLGITGAQSAAAATIPQTVNLVNAGGTMGTAGGLSGLLQSGQQVASDVVGAVKANPLTQWLKENPTLGRLVMGGVGSLLSSSGGQSSSAAPRAPVYGAPVQWNSPIQRGLLSQPQLYAPAAITQMRPAGLLATGFENDGAWRYLRG